jgi:hypothetical protein
MSQQGNERMNKRTEEAVKIWPYDQVPRSLKRIAGKKSDWVALIPPSLAWPEVEALFLRWDVCGHRVSRRILADGSVLLSGEDIRKM